MIPSKEEGLVMFKRQGFDQIVWISLILMTVVFTLPMFGQGIPSGHDLIYHFSRIVGSFDLLNRGEFPARILPGFYYNLGYPVGLFYPMGLLYVASGLMALGVDFILAYKVLIVLITLLTSISMYFASYGILKNRNSALLSTAILVFSIYRGLVDLYVRAAIGEYIAFIFIPLAFYGIYRILYEDDRKGYILAFAMWGLLTSHTLSTLLVILFFILMIIVEVKKLLKDKNILLTLIKAASMVIIVSVYYWAPMLEMMFSDVFQFSFPWTSLAENTLSSVSQVLYVSMTHNAFPYGYEIWNLFLILAIVLILGKKRKAERFIYIIVAFFVISFVIVANIIPIKYLGFLNFIQFPWRMLIFMTVFGAWIIGYGFSSLNESISRRLWIPIVLFLMSMYVLSTSHYFNVEMKEYKYKAFPRFSIEHSYAEFLPENIDMDWLISIRKAEGVKPSYPIELEYTQDLLSYYVYFNQGKSINTTLEFPIIFYKGFAAYYMNGEDSGFLSVHKSSDGLLEVSLADVPDGNIKVFYNGTRIQKYSIIFSVIAVLLFLVVRVFQRRRLYEDKR